MFWGTVLLTLLMAVLFTMIFTLGLKRPGPWTAGWTFFLVVFLAAWAGSLWLSPAGPAFIGIHWLPILLISFVVALLLAAMTPPRQGPSHVETISQVHQQEAARKDFDMFFWILLASLAFIILLGYLLPGDEGL